MRGQTIGLSESTVQKLLQDWKQKYNRDLRRPREWACEAILKTQMYAPSAAVRIMDYFKRAQNVLVNQGVLMPQPKAEPPARLHFVSHATQTTPADWAAVAEVTPQPRQPVGRTPIDEASPPSASPATPATPATLPAGLLRGGEGSGRGGGHQPGFKVAVCELVSDCGVPIRAVPKAFAVIWNAIHRRAPPADALFGHSAIAEWISDQGAAGLQKDIAGFRACRNKWGDTKLHVHHDGTGRVDRALGDHAHLMAFVASYFDPGLDRAVWFVLSMRFVVGGTADQTAHGLLVSLADLADQMRGLQLAARMKGATKEKMAEAPEARAFRKKREMAWEKALLREAKAFEAEALEKRRAGRAVLPQNPFAQERTRKKDEAKKARELEPSSPTGFTPPAKKGAAKPGAAKAPRPGPLLG